MNSPEFTLESFLQGRLLVFQPRQGYRFSIDAFLLAGFVKLKDQTLALELGAGCGIVSLLLAQKGRGKLVALEIQERLARCLSLNIRQNRLEDRLFAVRGDLRSLPFKGETFDIVFTNPPFYPLGKGRLAPQEEERLARHEILASLEDILQAAKYALRNRGRLFLIFPAQRLAELLIRLSEARFEPKRLRLVHSYPGSEAKLLLLEAVKGGGRELRVLPPLFIYTSPGGPYSPEVARLFEPS